MSMNAEQVGIPQALPPIETQSELYVVVHDERSNVLLHGHGIEKRGRDPDWRLPGGAYSTGRGAELRQQVYTATGGIGGYGKPCGYLARFHVMADAVHSPGAEQPQQRLVDYFHLAVAGIEPKLGLKLPHRQFRWMRMEVALGSLALPEHEAALRKLLKLSDGTWGQEGQVDLGVHTSHQ